MRCSSSEASLDAYVEGTLDPRRRALVAAHLEGCAACSSLLEEFRVIDALLLQPRVIEPAPNFTFKVMAEIRDMPAPSVHHVPTFAVLATYVVFAWALIGGIFVFARGAALASFAALDAWLARVGALALSVANATGHVFGHRAVDVTAAMGGLLVADVVVAGLAFALYSTVRARRSATGGVDAC